MQRIKLKLDEHIKKLNIQQKEFAEMSKLRPATISQMVNNKYDRIQLEHLLKVMQTLDLTDFNEILEIVDEREKE
ncbi:helix-turn-helix transcriptional regulator [Rummeliibacillus sp. POC4]|uniref:helix-turn-helix domain-containing protein n=1 Tax=Rummeliibacillus sp. POC4 TaxID=2305899 RepID=UPI000E66840D|nr:helix-turn-helix transcriptional regulator [Rummeliibacillus sp. POC4]RIJ63785.1 XRE family transcriptional regulator [Rummeliibacillus sp. POC4]